VIPFLLGFLISLIAAIPAWLLLRGSATTEFVVKFKLWAIGLLIRFAIIGGALLYLFTQTLHAKIPVIAGILVAYFLTFLWEAYSTLRAK
jgi:hypothetical protein